MNIQIDPEFRDLIRELSLTEELELKKDLTEHGNLDPIKTWNGVIVDGHHRYKLCTELGIPLLPPVEMDFEDRRAAKIWILRNQMARRNLHDVERYRVSQLLLDLITEITKEEGLKRISETATAREAAKRGDQPKLEPAEAATYTEQSERSTAGRMAKEAGMSRDKYQKLRYIDKNAPEVLERIEEGDYSINKAYEAVKAAVKAKEEGKTVTGDVVPDDMLDFYLNFELPLEQKHFFDLGPLLKKLISIRPEDVGDGIPLHEGNLTILEVNVEKANEAIDWLERYIDAMRERTGRDPVT